MTEDRAQAWTQLSRHRARVTDLPGPYGPIAALRADALDRPQATVLLVPGYTGSKEDFVPLLDGIAEAGFDVVAIDLPGQHHSPGPDDERAYLPDALGEVVRGLVESLDAEGGPVLLLGHSYGGLVARGAVLAGAPIAGLTLMASGPGRLPAGARRDALDLGEPLLRAQGTKAAYQVRESMSARDPGWVRLPEELKNFFRARFEGSSAAGLLGMATALRSEPDRVDDLAAALVKIEAPCLVVTGERDDAWSVPEQRAMAARLSAEFTLVPGAAHSPNTENPAAFLEILLRSWTSWSRNS